MGVVSETYLLNHRIRYAQPTDLYRTGIEPVLLAAAVPAKPGQAVLELGTGAGAGLLCLATRVAGVRGVGVEVQERLVALARGNLLSNDLADRCSVVAGDAARVCPDGPFDHAFANPPWHAEGATASPHPERDVARRARGAVLLDWVGLMAKRLRHRGTVTVILPGGALPAGLAALAASGCGSPTVLPLWPKPGREAKLVVIQGIRGGAGPCRILPGLTLHQPDGRYTADADAILRHGDGLLLQALPQRGGAISPS
jgi:tRNA1(Val) A37 N6-methylase TrmN6